MFFDTDVTELSAAAQATLDKQAAWLNQYSRYTFTIEGHADERGTREYNFALGSRRAEATKDYLIAKGVAASRMKTISYGKERPVAVCNDISCWSQNRRAVTVLAGAAGKLKNKTRRGTAKSSPHFWPSAPYAIGGPAPIRRPAGWPR